MVSISVVKGEVPEGDMHGVDAISGGTITSRALENAIRQWLTDYRQSSGSGSRRFNNQYCGQS